MAVWDILSQIWTIGRRLEDLLKLQDKTRTALQDIELRLRSMEDRMTRLEAEQGQLITEAKAAAGVAATGLASAVVTDIVTRLTRIEMRQDDHQRRLAPPMS